MSVSNVNTSYGTKVKYASRYFTFDSKTKIALSSLAIIQSEIGQLEAVVCKIASFEKGGYDD